MRLLANENIPVAAVEARRSAGHDVAWVRDDRPGSSDSAVLIRAIDEERILITFDKDFGELAWRTALPKTSGVILLRLPMRAPLQGSAMIASVVDSRRDWAGHFSVVEPDRIRMRSLPFKA